MGDEHIAGLSNASLWGIFKWVVLLIPFTPIIVTAQDPLAGDEILQSGVSGSPFVTNYTPDDYEAFNQNWGTVEDSSGIIYIANGDGVLIYDGSEWDLVPLPNHTHAKSIAVDINNRIFVGGSGEFGYLASQENGKVEYISLVPQLDDQDRAFSTVWECIATDRGVYFKTNERLFRWSDSGFRIWRSPEFRRLFIVKGTVYTLKPGEGIHFIDGKDSIRPVQGGGQFAQEAVTLMLPFGESGLLVGTYSNGLFVLKDGVKNRFHTGADAFLSDNKLYAGTILNNNTYALGFLSGGMIVIDGHGNQLLQLGGDLLVSGIIHHLYQDSQGILWASLNDGIAKLEYPSPFSVFDQRSGIGHRVQLIGRYREKILVGTDAGLFQLETGIPGVSASFSLFEGISDQVWDLLEFDGMLLMALRDGVFQLSEVGLTMIGDWSPSAFLRSAIDPNRIYISLANGLRSIYYVDGKWRDEGIIEGVLGPTYTIVEMDSGNLWLETSENWLWRIVFENRDRAKILESPIIEKYGFEQGLPGEPGNIFHVSHQLYFSSEDSRSTVVFHPGSKRFEPAVQLSNTLGMPEIRVFIHHIDQAANIWFSTGNEVLPRDYFVGWSQQDGQYQVATLILSRIENRMGGSGMFFYDQANSVLWIPGKESVIRHDLRFEGMPAPLYHSLVRRIIYRGDSLLIGGHYHTAVPEIPQRDNHLRFQFASTGFHEEKATLYQYFLEGFDRKWSSWTVETQRDFTNLPGGSYTFHVRARNIFGTISTTDRIAFRIRPPWYRTIWAYLLYLFASGVIIGTVVRWRSGQLRREKAALEQIVAERTRQLSRQAEKLREIDRMKSRFFANISHEFRTPLTLIRGPVSELIKGQNTHLSLKDARMIELNSDRLLRLVNQLLDLARLDDGSLKPEPAPGDIFRFLRIHASAFSSYAAQRKLSYHIEVPETTFMANFDHSKLEMIVYNLLSNAFKYTSEEGCISFRVNCDDDRLLLMVSDNGKGIPESQLSRIYDRFYQMGGPETGEFEGTGIGLALTKELVALLEGNISVRSKEGVGSSFRVDLPVDAIQSGVLPDEDKYREATDPVEGFREAREATDPVEGFRETTDPDDAGTAVNVRSSIILIVEDHDDMRDFIKQNLRGYRLLEAANGQEGLRLAIDAIPDLVITDVKMPFMDGTELCRRLKSDERTSHIPVIMLTAKAGLEYKVEGLETGADDYLTKPFERDELAARVKNLIMQRERLRRHYSRQIFLQPEDMTVTSVDEKFISKVMEVLEKKYPDEHFGVPQMQEALAMSKTQLHRKVKALTGRAPGEFLREYRLQKAVDFLIHDGGNVTEAAFAVGFGSLSYFTRSFKKLYHQSPSQFAARYKTH